jgi:acetylornithine deacetylase/succinyl-diaminopimelate desuccinylase-like protein
MVKFTQGVHRTIRDDENGKVAVPGFYDEMVEISKEEKAAINFDFDAERYKKTFGVDAHGGEKGISPLERAFLRPSIEINGINGGYSGPGFKTVIPAKAIAKVSCRLVRFTSCKRLVRVTKRVLQGSNFESRIF